MNLSCRYHLGFSQENSRHPTYSVLKTVTQNALLSCLPDTPRTVDKKWQEGPEDSQVLSFILVLGHIQVGVSVITDVNLQKREIIKKSQNLQATVTNPKNLPWKEVFGSPLST